MPLDTDTYKELRYRSVHAVAKAPSKCIRIFFNPQIFLCGFKGFHVYTYPYSYRIRPSARIRIHSQFVS